MGERNDVDLGFAKLTQKTMPNGEVRTRMKLPNGVATTITEMPHWDPRDGLPWQEEHFHRGLTECYLIIKGSLILVYNDGSVGVEYLRSEGVFQSKIFIPGEHHLVLSSPGCVFQTTTYGIPIGNPDKNRNDWWPGDGVLLKYAKEKFKDSLTF